MRMPVLLDARAGLLGRPGGWERYTAELATRLADRVHVVPSRGPRHQATSVLWEWTALPWAARGMELVHLPAYPPTPVVRAPVVYTLHDLVWLKHPQWQSRGGRLYYRRVAARALSRVHLVAVSQAVADELADELHLQADVIPNGVRAVPLSTVPEVRERPYLLSVGAVEPRKNLARLIAAYDKSGLAGVVDLVLVGRTAWGSLPPGVLHLGAVDDARLDRLYRGATAVVSASLYEGFGLPVAEALAAGAPVVCSDIAAYREVAAGAAQHFDPLSETSIVAALRAAAAGQLPTPAPALRDRWSWQRCAAQHEDLYARLLGGHP
ncbi:MAG: glycosyl transferase group 1 [Frankiales bacterium]|nr:glycosyl transferase group 1 [Frankiales bacterium]